MTTPAETTTTTPGTPASTVGAAPTTTRPSRGGRDWRGFSERWALLVLLLLVGLLFALLPKSRETFVSANNLSFLLGNQATVAMLALAAIIPLVSGYFDFSLGANAALSTVLCAGLQAHQHLPVLVACALVLVVSAGVGLVDGLLVTRFGLNSFVTTLGMATLIGGIIQWYTNGQTILAGISPRLVSFGSLNFAGIPQVVYIVVVVAAILWYMLNQTPYGRSLYAVGVNPRAATLVGIRANRYVMLSFVIAGAIAGVTGILQLARTGSATASDGTGLLFPALAAAFLGATAVKPGFFNVIGTLIGVLFVSVAVSGLTLAGAASWVSPVFNGAALLIAVGLSSYLGRHRGRAA